MNVKMPPCLPEQDVLVFVDPGRAVNVAGEKHSLDGPAIN